MTPVQHFLVVYNRRQGAILEQQTFAEPDVERALAARFECEKRYAGSNEIEVAVIDAPSFESLARTHARYFQTAAELLATA
jgi:hypothetical protein